MGTLTPQERRARYLPQSLDAPFPEPDKEVEVTTMGIRQAQLVCGNCLKFEPTLCSHSNLYREENFVACCEIHRFFCDFGFIEPPGRTSWIRD